MPRTSRLIPVAAALILGVASAAAGQLESIYGISSSAAYTMLGTTPMIGQNDSSGEIFTLAAAAAESYAAQQGIAMLSFWAAR